MIRRALRNKTREYHKKTKFDWVEGKGIITRDVSASTQVVEEREPEYQSRKKFDLSPTPLFERPNMYAGKKRCATCVEWKPVDDYTDKRDSTDGKKSYCKRCVAEMKRLKLTPTEYRGHLVAQSFTRL